MHNFELKKSSFLLTSHPAHTAHKLLEAIRCISLNIHMWSHPLCPRDLLMLRDQLIQLSLWIRNSIWNTKLLLCY